MKILKYQKRLLQKHYHFSIAICIVCLLALLSGCGGPANPAELPWIFLLDPTPPAPPLLPPLLLGALRVRAFLLRPRDPGDASGDGAPWLDARVEVVAEERRAGEHSGEALRNGQRRPCTPRHLA